MHLNVNKIVSGILIYGFLLFWVVFVIVDYRYAQNLRKNEPNHYTIGSIESMKYYSPASFIFKFKVDSTEFVSYFHIKNIHKSGYKKKEFEKHYKGRKYLVRYSIIDPEVNDLLMDYPVLDSTLIAPNQGWDSIPTHIVPRHPIIPKNYP